MLGMTASFFLVEIIVGYITNSIALVADSFHMFSDVVALIVGFASVRVSKASDITALSLSIHVNYDCILFDLQVCIVSYSVILLPFAAVNAMTEVTTFEKNDVAKYRIKLLKIQLTSC